MLRSLFWSFMEQGGSKFAQLVVQVVLARLLAPEVFGVLAILLVFVNIADAIAQSGMGTALIQRDGADDLDYSTAFWMSLVLALVMYSLLFFAAPFIESFYDMDGLVAPLRVISLTFVFNSINSIQRSRLQRSMDFRTLCKANVFALVVGGVLGIVAASMGFGIWALVVQYVCQAVTACIALVVLSPWSPSLAFIVDSAGELYSYGWKICATSVLGTVYTSVSELVLGLTCSSEDLGLYSQGRKWPNAAIQLVTNALQNVFLPKFATLQHNLAALRASMRKMLVCGSFVVVPISCAAAVASEPIVYLLLGEAWLECVPVFAMSCLCNCVTILQITNLRAYMALGRSDLYLILQAIKVVIGGIVTALVAVSTGNISWVAVALLAVSFFNVLVIDLWPAYSIHGYRRIDQLRDVSAVFGVSGIASLCALVVGVLWSGSYLIELLLQLVSFAIAFVTLSHMLHVEGYAEVANLVRRLALHIKKRK